MVFWGEGPGVSNVSCSRATSRLHRCKSGVALEQETFSRLPGHPPKRLLAPFPNDLGAIQEFGGCTRQLRFLCLFLFLKMPDVTPKSLGILHVPSGTKLLHTFFFVCLGRVTPRMGPRAAPRVRPREPSRGLISLFAAPRQAYKGSHESSHEGVHRRAHEWTVGVHQSCFHLFCSLTIFPPHEKVRNGKSAQRVSFGAGYPADVHADIPADVRGQKLRSSPRNPGKTSISVRTSMTRRRGCP